MAARWVSPDIVWMFVVRRIISSLISPHEFKLIVFLLFAMWAASEGGCVLVVLLLARLPLNTVF